MKLLRLLLWSVLLTSGAIATELPKPDPERLKIEMAILDDYEKESMTEGQDSNVLALKIARERGPHIVHTIMYRARKWQGEEGILYIAMIAFLPRHPPSNSSGHTKNPRTRWCA